MPVSRVTTRPQHKGWVTSTITLTLIKPSPPDSLDPTDFTTLPIFEHISSAVILEDRILIVALEDNKLLVKAPRFILQHSFHIWFVIEDKEKFMVTQIPYLKPVTCSPQRSKGSCYRINAQHSASQNLAIRENSSFGPFFKSFISSPSLSIRERLL